MQENAKNIARPLALERATAAEAMTRSCRLCAFRCGVDRTQDAGGRCGCGHETRVFAERVVLGGEEELVPTYEVCLSGCNLKCAFCVALPGSQDSSLGAPLDIEGIAARIREKAPSLRSVSILGGEPAIHLPAALRIAARVPADIPLVWKTNTYTSPEALELIDGIADVVVADYKFGADDCARRLCGAERYQEIIQSNLKWMRAHSRLIVRHLLMPGHLECCFLPVVDWLAANMPEIPLSLMEGFLPNSAWAARGEADRLIHPSESSRARREAEARGLRLIPWQVAAGPAGDAGLPRRIIIDRHGRICLDSDSSDLLSFLQGLSEEVKTQ
ncbi:MAG: radical SAM protein [Candidatus Sumerlaeota bacterium]|nr:radical SAM protein [Candidatus Sumerlaeota bacterium]